MKADSSVRYGTVSRYLHWGMAVLIAWQMMKFFDRIGDGEHWVGQVLASWHVSIGTLLLLLAIGRIVWASKQRNRRPEPAPATAWLVKAGHALLYLAMAVLPITGIMVLVGNGFGLAAFGIPLVAPGTDIAWMAELGGRLHSPVPWLLLIMVACHIGMAFFHYFVKKDGVLQRMA